MYKNFIQNIGSKEHITAVHEERDWIMINVAKNLHYLKVYIEIVHKKTLNSIVITVAKISPKLSWIRENTGLKLQITAVHENKKMQFEWSCKLLI